MGLGEYAETTRLLVRVPPHDRNVDMEPLTARRLDQRFQTECRQRVAKKERRGDDVREWNARWVEIEEHRVRAVRPIAPRRPDVEVDAAEINEPEEGVDGVDEDVADGCAAARLGWLVGRPDPLRQLRRWCCFVVPKMGRLRA